VTPAARAKIRDLTPGTRFRYPDCGKRAVLVALSESGARIKYDGSERQVEFQAKSGDEVIAEVAFTAPGKVYLVSDYSDVEVLGEVAGLQQ
jgi:hypothetical protein